MKIAGDEDSSHLFVALRLWYNPHVGEQLRPSLEFDDYGCALGVFSGDIEPIASSNDARREPHGGCSLICSINSRA